MKYGYMICTVSLLVAIGILSAQTNEPDQPDKSGDTEVKLELTTDQQRISYALGLEYGGRLRKDGMALDPNLVATGIRDGLTGTKPRLTATEYKEVMNKIRQQIQAKHAALSEKNLKDGQAFLEKNKEREGVMTRPSGLQYEVLTEGEGQSPKATDRVTIHFTGSLTNGNVFMSSEGEPRVIVLSRLIKGWAEGLQLMKEGANYKLYIPSNLAYGPAGRPGSPIGPNSTLILEVELIKVGE